MKKIAIITTKQNYVWTSMQEVLPGIEKCWQLTNTKSRIFNIDVEPFRAYFPFVATCDAIIIIAFNETISRFIVNIRKNLNLEIPIVLHLYGHATIACWPQKRFGTLDCLNDGDALVGTCEGDQLCIEKTFSNAKFFNVPYPYIPLENFSASKFNSKYFVFVGRISDQKNLHLLIKSYAFVRDQIKTPPPLVIYGKEDFLGSPNMGISSSQCLDQLKMLIKELHLEQSVIFKGFQAKETIYSELGKNHIFVSTSCHSDENFGMAALRSLSLGGKAVLSNWGGHKNFKKHFNKKVWISDVYFEDSRPVIDPKEFAHKMLRSFLNEDDASMEEIPAHFLPNSIAQSFDLILSQLSFSNRKLETTAIAQKIYDQQKFFETQGNIQKVFKDYRDELAQVFLSAYA